MNQPEQAQRGGPDTPRQLFALRAIVGKAARQASCVMEMLLLGAGLKGVDDLQSTWYRLSFYDKI